MNLCQWIFLIWTLVFWGSVETVSAGPVTFNGTWNYKDTGGETGDLFTQSYGINFAEDIELNSAMALSGSTRYDYRDNDGDVRQVLSPALSYNLNNDIFRFSLYGSATKTLLENNGGNTVRSWESQLDNGWDDSKLPQIQVSFGQTRDSDNLIQHGRDISSNYGGANLEWQYDSLIFFYSYYSQAGEDRVNDSSNSSATHLARLDFSRSFWRNRLRVDMSHQYNQVDSENTVPVGPGNIALTPVQFQSVTAGVDVTPAQTVTLPSALTLIDGDLNSMALSVEPNEVMNIVMRTDFQTMDLLYLYTVKELVVESYSFSWDLYVSADGLLWTLAGKNISYLYNQASRRFELDMGGVEELFVKVVTDITPRQRVDFSEIAGFQRITATGSYFSNQQDTSFQLTDLNTSFRLSSSVQLAYSLSLKDGEIAGGVGQYSLDQASSLQWSPLGGRFSAALTGSDSLQDYDDRPLLGNRSFGLNLTSQLLPTLDISIALVRAQVFEEGDLLSDTNNYSFYSNATILPDLQSSFNLAYSEGTILDSDQLNTNLNSRLRFTARLLPSLEVDVIGNYSQTKNEVETVTTDGSFNLSWRVSDILSTSLIAKKKWEEIRSDSVDFGGSVSLAITRNNQLNITYAYEEDREQLERTSFNWHWVLTEVFSLRGYGNYLERAVLNEEDYLKGDPTEWQIGAELIMRSNIWE